MAMDVNPDGLKGIRLAVRVNTTLLNSDRHNHHLVYCGDTRMSSGE